MGIIGTTPLVDRAIAVLHQYLDTEVDAVDTACNALSTAGAEAHFTTPDIPDAAIQFGDDDKSGRAVRVIVGVDRPPVPGQYQHGPADAHGTVRADHTHRISVMVIVNKVTGAWGDDGAIRRCDRVATAVNTLLGLRFRKLSVPDATPALAEIPGVVLTQESDDWIAPDTQEFVARRRLVFAAKFRQTRTE